ncbi:hypothetical protein TNIN_406351 [Trichonephila inaurata madagascariensis]|uniref:Uncharacterized protein n=1 Tax=Trichonephila inaurata madagascariensis TaxID=2747483 RepID=A0A8X6WRZ4_9ARAC|nr:hypothetical protein TNIN_406351 [Trichonephila inaurata madagascariensis]
MSDRHNWSKTMLNEGMRADIDQLTRFGTGESEITSAYDEIQINTNIFIYLQGETCNNLKVSGSAVKSVTEVKESEYLEKKDSNFNKKESEKNRNKKKKGRSELLEKNDKFELEQSSFKESSPDTILHEIPDDKKLSDNSSVDKKQASEIETKIFHLQDSENQNEQVTSNYLFFRYKPFK